MVSFPETINGKKVSASLWEKNGKSRVYFKVLFAGSSPVDCGFICGETGDKAIKSSPVSWGHRLESEVTFQEKSSRLATEKTFNTGLGYYGTAADAARGFDGIE